MKLKLLLIPRLLNRSIAARARKRDLYRFLEEFEALNLFYGLKSRLGAVVDDERLALGFKVPLRDDIDDISVL